MLSIESFSAIRKFLSMHRNKNNFFITMSLRVEK